MAKRGGASSGEELVEVTVDVGGEAEETRRGGVFIGDGFTGVKDRGRGGWRVSELAAGGFSHRG